MADPTLDLLNSALAQSAAPPPGATGLGLPQQGPTAPVDQTLAILQAAQNGPDIHPQAAADGQAGYHPLPVHMPQWAIDQGLEFNDNDSGAFTTMMQGPSLGFEDEIDGGLASLQHNIMPLVTGQPTHFAQDYNDVSTAVKNQTENYSAQHPTKALLSQMLLSLPAAGAGAVEDAAVAIPEYLASKSSLMEKAPGLIKNTARGATMGGVYGGVAGFGNADPGNRLDAAADGAKWGAGLGAVGVPVATAIGTAGQKLANVLTGAKPLVSSDTTAAAKILLDKIGADNTTPATLTAQLRADPTGQMTIADLGGENSNTKRLARALVTMPGPASNNITDFIAGRDAGQTGRVMGSVTSKLGDGGDVYQLSDALERAKLEQSRPLYEAAGIPQDKEDYATAPTVNTPQIQYMLGKSADVQAAIAQARRLPAYSDLPNNSMVLLDKAYKNIGGSAYEAKVAGNNEKARDMYGLRNDLLDAITGGDPDHPYQQALNAYSGAANTQDALQSGTEAFNQDAKLTSQEFNNHRPGDKTFYQIGFASALQKKLNSAADGRDAVKVIYGNPNIRANIESVFGTDAAANFDKAMTSEKAMDATSNYLTSGSQTANKLGDIVTPTLLARVGSDAMQGAVVGGAAGGLHGAAAGAVGLPMLNLGKSLAANIQERANTARPATAAELAKMLTTPGATGADYLDNTLGKISQANAQTNASRAALAHHLSAGAPLAGIAGAALSQRSQAQQKDVRG
jgi:hypothetical protein